MKKIAVVLAILIVLSFPFIAHAQITKDQYYARSTLEGNELEFYDERYNSFAKGDTERNSNFGLSEERAQQIVQYVYGDAPELYASYGFYDNTEKLNAQLKAKSEEILSPISEDMTDIEKYEVIYRWIGENVDYDTQAEQEAKDPYEDEEAASFQTIIGGLLNERAVCSGMARSLQYLLYQLDIPCYSVTGIYGDTGGRHKWTIVQLDGNWYYSDVTQAWNIDYDPNSMLRNDTFLEVHDLTPDEYNPPLPACTTEYWAPLETPEPTPTVTHTPEPTVENTPAPVVANVEPQEPPGDGGNYTGWIIAVAAAVAIIAGMAARNRRKKRT